MTKRRFKIIPAVYLVLIRDNKILLLKRQNTGFEDGKYSMIAGHLDGKETFKQAMVREAKEEACIDINIEDLEVVHVLHRTNDEMAHEEDGIKYPERIDIFLQAEKWIGEIVNNEPGLCESLEWFDIDNLPENVIDYIKSAIKHVKKGIVYSEFGW